MEKLELQHLAPYLPYGLKYYLPLDNYRISDFVYHEPWKFTHDIFTAIESGYESALEYKNMTISQNNPFLCIEDKELFLGQMKSSLGFDLDDVFLNEVKPILRPLSDLIKEIYYNGEKIIPISKLFDIVTNLEYSKSKYIEVNYGKEEWWVNIYTNKSNAFGYNKENGFYFLNNSIVRNQKELWEKLFEWHFDVFGLIEKGLAIDINTFEL